MKEHISRIPKIERWGYEAGREWHERSFAEYLTERIEKGDDSEFDEPHRGEFESVETAIERTRAFCVKMSEMLIEKGLIDFADVFALVEKKYNYRFDGKEAEP